MNGWDENVCLDIIFWNENIRLLINILGWLDFKIKIIFSEIKEISFIVTNNLRTITDNLF